MAQWAIKMIIRNNYYSLIKAFKLWSPLFSKLLDILSVISHYQFTYNLSTQNHRFVFTKPVYIKQDCSNLKILFPIGLCKNVSSSVFTVADSNGHIRHIYCHMEELWGSDEGWMRVAYLNMSDPTEDCPPGFRLY